MSDFNFSKRVFILAVVFLAGLFVFWGFRIYEIYVDSTGDYPREITVEATGSAYVVPDTAKIDLGVNTQADTSEEAVDKNAEKMNAVIAVLKKLDIPEEDIKTRDYYLSEDYWWDENGNRVDNGYYIEQNVEVSVKDLEKTGDVIAEATSVGANFFGGIRFEVDDPETAKDEARMEAIKKVKEKADAIAEASGLKLGKVLSYYEYTPYNYGKGAYAESAVSYDSYAEPMAVPSIEPGQEEVSLTVSLTYRIK